MAWSLFEKKRISDIMTGNGEEGAFVEMSQIVKTFVTPAGNFEALKEIDIQFDRGEFVSVVGKSGSGKSTLVNMLTGIDHPTSGSVRIGETYVHKLNESQMARWRGRNLGIVFQFYQLLPMLSLIENVMLPMDLCDMYAPSERPKRAIELLDLVGLADVAHKMPSAVSGGQQQSAAIARALANDPPLLAADEPTGNLDSRAAERVFHTFEDLARRGKTIIVVTHDPDLAQRAFRTVLLADGEVIHETVANTLPLLTHEQMLKATKHLEPRQFGPGETILEQGQPNDRFYMISQGHAQVLLTGNSGKEVTVAQLGPGEHFGEVSLLKRIKTTASVKAAMHAPVQVVTLHRRIFSELLDEAQAMREAITRIVYDRLTQNTTLETGWAMTGGLGAQASLA
jgi:ABC-type lipoprotein export system ATPase subunit